MSVLDGLRLAGVREEVARMDGLPQDVAERAIAGETAPPASLGPWGSVVMGQAIPPAGWKPGDPRRIYDAARVTLSTGAGGRVVPTWWLWAGERRKVAPVEVVAELNGRPRWARVICLEFPHGLCRLGPDGKPTVQWHRGIDIDPDYAIALPGLIEAAFGGLRGLDSTTIYWDEELAGTPWELQQTGQWPVMLAAPTLERHLAEAGITRAELTTIGTQKPAEAALTVPWQRWADYTHRLLARHMAWVLESLVNVTGIDFDLASANHYHRCPSLLPTERAGVYHASPIGAGELPGATQIVKNYGHNDGQIWSPIERKNCSLGSQPWMRLVRDQWRRMAALKASRVPVVTLHQCNFVAPENGLPNWLFEGLAELDFLGAALETGNPIWWSQAQEEPQRNPAKCLAWTRWLERWLERLDELTGGMPGYGVEPSEANLLGTVASMDMVVSRSASLATRDGRRRALVAVEPAQMTGLLTSAFSDPVTFDAGQANGLVGWVP